MATCAVCERPIARHAKFLLVETEVVHRDCLGRGETRMARRAAEWEQAQRDNAELRRELREARTQLATARAEAETDRQAMLSIRSMARSDARNMQARHDAELATLRLELAAVQSTQHTSVQSGPAAIPESPPVDDAAVRFSLLDLDPL